MNKKEWDFAKALLSDEHNKAAFREKVSSKHTSEDLRKHIRATPGSGTWGRSNGMQSIDVLKAIHELRGFPADMDYLHLPNTPSGFMKPSFITEKERAVAKNILVNTCGFLAELNAMLNRRYSLGQIERLVRTYGPANFEYRSSIDILRAVERQLWFPENMKYLDLSKQGADNGDYKNPANWPKPVPCTTEVKDLNFNHYSSTASKGENEEALYNKIINDSVLLRDLPRSDPYGKGYVYIKARILSEIAPTNSSTKENIIMAPTQKFFDTKFLINGQDLSLMSNQSIYDAISRQSDKIKGLEAIPTQPQMLKDEIKAEKESLDALVKYLDSKGATEKASA